VEIVWRLSIPRSPVTRWPGFRISGSRGPALGLQAVCKWTTRDRRRLQVDYKGQKDLT
jgi:hypothetical protein